MPVILAMFFLGNKPKLIIIKNILAIIKTKSSASARASPGSSQALFQCWKNIEMLVQSLSIPFTCGSFKFFELQLTHIDFMKLNNLKSLDFTL